MTAISVSERLLEMAAFYTPLALTVTTVTLLLQKSDESVPVNRITTKLRKTVYPRQSPIDFHCHTDGTVVYYSR